LPYPSNPLQQAIEHHRAGRLQEAAALYTQVLQSQPENADALYLLGLTAHQTGDPGRAAKLIERAIARRPKQAHWHNILGLAYTNLDRDAEAQAAFERAISLDTQPEFWNNLGLLHKTHRRIAEAETAFVAAIGRDPKFADAHYNLGNLYVADRKSAEARASFERALQANPAHAHALAAMGQLLSGSGEPGEAVPMLEKALSLLSNDAGLYCDLGDALEKLQRLKEASAAYRNALRLDPKLRRAWYSAGCVESASGAYPIAMVCFGKALEIQADWHEAQHNLARVHFEMGEVDEALALFRKAAQGPVPELPDAMIAVIIPGSPASDNQAIREARQAWADRYLPSPQPRNLARERGSTLRIGYVSSFFHRENWMKPVWGLINKHDREGFEIHLFSGAPASASGPGYRAQPSDRFHDISGVTNEGVAQQIADAEIDVLVDLNGYSDMRRLPLFALRPAPVIAGWFNTFATTGMRYYDYLIGDDQVIPAEDERFYTEKILRVPGSYLTFEVSYPVPDVVGPPCGSGSPIAFGCLAPEYKITPEVIATWSRILQDCPTTTLLLKSTALKDANVVAYVTARFDKCGIASSRLQLEGPADHFEFLKAYNRIDIALDTFPYNGGTTTTEAIWQGVPAVSFWGDRWVSRTSASILRAGNLGRFVADSRDDYVKLAVQLANDSRTPEFLTSLRRNMREDLRRSSVCDTAGFARAIEAVYRQMMHRL
jgi:predicted O-linked N-acetylglucosamine transferase (SPINDLY family)